MSIQPSNLKRRRNFSPPPILAYDHQKAPIKAAMSVIEAGENGLIIQPPGTGKSTEAALIARAAILKLGIKILYPYYETTGLERAQKKFEYIFGDTGITTASFYGSEKDFDILLEADIVFTSWQSLNNHHEKWYQLFDRNHFGAIIVNEGHSGAAETYFEVLDYFQASLLGLTATEKRADGRDILKIFDKVIHRLSYEEAVVRRLVQPLEYQVCSAGISTSKLNKLLKEVLEEGKRISKRQLNQTIFIDKLDRDILHEIYEVAFPKDDRPRPGIIFCENIKHADRIVAQITQDGYLAKAVHSGHVRAYNNQALEDSEQGRLDFLVAVDKLNEDIDLPHLELAVFLRLTNSVRIFIQQMARPGRKKHFSRKSVIMDFVANVDRIERVQEMMQKIKSFSRDFSANNEKLFEGELILSGEHFVFEFNYELRDVVKLLQRIQEGYYPTWQEASEAAKEMKIKSSRDYSEKYMQHSRLPGCPRDFYSDFPGWNIFLDSQKKKKKYETWQEASEAAFSLGIKDIPEYKKRWKEDPLLPTHPHRKYSDYPGADIFLKKTRYSTWQEASEAAIALGIKSGKEYKVKSGDDPRLPYHPDRFYANFPNWYFFLANKEIKKKRSMNGGGKKNTQLFYSTWQEASGVAIEMGIKTRDEYREKYHNDKLLVKSPHYFYPDFPGFKVFLGKE